MARKRTRPPLDKSAVMRQAHSHYRYFKAKGWSDDWPFSRCLKFAWAQAKGRAELRRAA